MGFWYDDPRRVYVESTRSHNTVEIDGRSYERKRRKPYGSALKYWGERDGVFFAESAVSHDSITHSRMLLHKPHDWLIVLDWVVDSQEKPHDVRQWFKLNPELSVTRSTNGMVHVTGEALTKDLWMISLIPGPESGEPITGQTDPVLQGWWSPESGVFEPAWSVCLEQSQSDQVAFVTLFAFGDEPRPVTQSCNMLVSEATATLTWSQGPALKQLDLNRQVGGEPDLRYSEQAEQ